MASVTLKRGTKAEIEATSIQDGQLLMETDQLNNNKIWMDLPSGERVPVGGSGAWVGTQAEFDQAQSQGQIAEGTQVIITDDYNSNYSAQEVTYSNTTSGLTSTNVQGAIDELDDKVDELIEQTEVIFAPNARCTISVSELRKVKNKVYGCLTLKATSSLGVGGIIGYMSEKPKRVTAITACNSTTRTSDRMVSVCYLTTDGQLVAYAPSSFANGDDLQIYIDYYTE